MAGMSESELGAAEALQQARQLGATVRVGSRWYLRYLLSYAGLSAALVLSIGLSGGAAGALIATGLFLALTGILSAWALRQRVWSRGASRRHVLMMIAWGLLYGLVLAAGLGWFRGNLAWWLPGAVAVALPPLAGALAEARQ
jgi:hypothetical protein